MNHNHKKLADLKARRAKAVKAEQRMAKMEKTTTMVSDLVWVIRIAIILSTLFAIAGVAFKWF